MHSFIDPWRTAILPSEAQHLANVLVGHSDLGEAPCIKRSIVLGDRADGALCFSGIFDVFEHILERWLGQLRKFPISDAFIEGVTQCFAEALDSEDVLSGAAPFMVQRHTALLTVHLLDALDALPLVSLVRYGCPVAIRQFDEAVLHIFGLWNRLALGLLWMTGRKSTPDPRASGWNVAELLRCRCVMTGTKPRCGSQCVEATDQSAGPANDNNAPQSFSHKSALALS